MQRHAHGEGRAPDPHVPHVSKCHSFFILVIVGVEPEVYHFFPRAQSSNEDGRKNEDGRNKTKKDGSRRIRPLHIFVLPYGIYVYQVIDDQEIAITRACVSGRLRTTTRSTPFSNLAVTVDGSAVSGKSTLTA